MPSETNSRLWVERPPTGASSTSGPSGCSLGMPQKLKCCSNALREMDSERWRTHRAGARCSGLPLRILDAMARALASASLWVWAAWSKDSAMSSRRKRAPAAQRWAGVRWAIAVVMRPFLPESRLNATTREQGDARASRGACRCARAPLSMSDTIKHWIGWTLLQFARLSFVLLFDLQRLAAQDVLHAVLAFIGPLLDFRRVEIRGSADHRDRGLESHRDGAIQCVVCIDADVSSSTCHFLLYEFAFIQGN